MRNTNVFASRSRVFPSVALFLKLVMVALTTFMRDLSTALAGALLGLSLLLLATAVIEPSFHRSAPNAVRRGFSLALVSTPCE
jgi:hypothetical protein